MIYNVMIPVYLDLALSTKIEFRQGPAITAMNDEDAIMFAKQLGIKTPVVQLEGKRKEYGNHYERNHRS